MQIKIIEKTQCLKAADNISSFEYNKKSNINLLIFVKTTTVVCLVSENEHVTLSLFQTDLNCV